MYHACKFPTHSHITYCCNLYILNKGHDDGAHPPIHPLKAFPLSHFHEEHKRNIYEIVVKHFMACCSKDAVGSQTDVLVQVPEGGEGFHCKGLMIHERNYLEIYRWEKWNANKVTIFNRYNRIYNLC